MARSRRARRALRVIASTLLAILAVAKPIQAQTVTLRTSVPNAIVGVVVDTSGMPLSDVTVMIRKLQRQTRTLPDGTFQFDSIPLGTHELSARAVGLLAGVTEVTVGPTGASVTITMVRFKNALAAVVTTASELGLSGIIGDTAFRAMTDVKVTVIGGAGSAHTDSTGAFRMPLSPGSYLLRVEKDGYARQTVGVSIPDNEGRRIAVWMVEQDGGNDAVFGTELFDLHARIMRVSQASAKFLTREDMSKVGAVDLHGLALKFGTGRINPDCQVRVGGTMNRWVTLGTLTASDIEFVEVYLPTFGTSADGTSGSRGITSLSGSATMFTTPTNLSPRPGASGACGNVSFTAWLRN